MPAKDRQYPGKFRSDFDGFGAELVVAGDAFLGHLVFQVDLAAYGAQPRVALERDRFAGGGAVTPRDLQAIDHHEFSVSVFDFGQADETRAFHVHGGGHALRAFTQDPSDGRAMRGDRDAQRQLFALRHELTAFGEETLDVAPGEPRELGAFFDGEPRIPDA